MRLIWVIIHLIFSVSLLSIPLLIFGWFDRDKRLVGQINRFWARWVIWSTGIHYDVVGLDKLDPGKQYIFMSNHESALDILLGVACLPYNIVFLAKKELFRIPVFGWAMAAAGTIKIDRQNRERSIKSVDLAVEILTKSKFSTLLYPEGTRSDFSEMLPFKKGGFILAIRSQLPIVPFTIIGAGSVLPKNSLTLQEGSISCIIDSPIETIHLQEGDKDQLLDQCWNVMIRNKEKYSKESLTYKTYLA